MSDDLIRWAPLAIVLIGIGVMVWAGLVMRRQEKESQGLRQLDICTVNVQDGDTIVLRYSEVLTREQRQAMTDMVERSFPGKKVTALFLEGGLYMDVIAKEARPTSDAADFGGMPG